MNPKKTLSICRPLIIPGSRDGILLLHGYTGCPYSFRNLVPYLTEKGYTISAPRYPGHGTDGDDFLRTIWRDWLRASLDAYYDLRQACDHITIIGFSMGGCISLILASMIPPKNLVLIAPAVFLNGWRIRLSFLLSFFVKKLPSGYEENSNVAEYQYLIDEYLRYYWPKQAHSLQRLSRMARKVLPNVISRTLVLSGERDEIVPIKAARFVFENISSESKELEIFKKSGHDLLNDAEKELVIKKIISWLENKSTGRRKEWI